MSTDEDRLVDELLDGQSPLAKVYEESREDNCPPDLEAKILAESHKAVRSRPALLQSYSFTRGFVPLALAATVLIGVGIVTLFPDPVVEEETTLKFRGASKSQETTTAATTDAEETAEESDEILRTVQVTLEQSEQVEGAGAAVSADAAETQALREQLGTMEETLLSRELENKELRERIKLLEEQVKNATRLLESQSADLAAAQDHWIASIKESRKQGRIAEAEQSLAEFKRRYPDYPLSDLE